MNSTNTAIPRHKLIGRGVDTSTPADNSPTMTTPDQSVQALAIPPIQPRVDDNIWLPAPLDSAGADAGLDMGDGSDPMRFWSNPGATHTAEVPNLYRKLSVVCLFTH